MGTCHEPIHVYLKKRYLNEVINKSYREAGLSSIEKGALCNRKSLENVLQVIAKHASFKNHKT